MIIMSIQIKQTLLESLPLVGLGLEPETPTTAFQVKPNVEIIKHL